MNGGQNHQPDSRTVTSLWRRVLSRFEEEDNRGMPTPGRMESAMVALGQADAGNLEPLRAMGEPLPGPTARQRLEHERAGAAHRLRAAVEGWIEGTGDWTSTAPHRLAIQDVDRRLARLATGAGQDRGEDQ